MLVSRTKRPPPPQRGPRGRYLLLIGNILFKENFNIYRVGSAKECYSVQGACGASLNTTAKHKLYIINNDMIGYTICNTDCDASEVLP